MAKAILALPAWAQQWVADFGLSACWQGEMAAALDRYAARHRECFRRRNKTADDRSAGDVSIPDICDIIAHMIAVTDLSPAEWEAWRAWAHLMARRDHQAAELVRTLSPEALAAVSSSGVTDADPGGEDAEVVALMLAFIRRVKGEATHRRMIYILRGLNDSGTEIRIGNTDSGEPFVELRATYSAAIPGKAG